MAGQPMRVVNVVPHVKIKKELPDVDDEECLFCRVCNKSFCNETALRNHARMEHFHIYATGDPSAWTQEPPPLVQVKTEVMEDDESIQQRTEELISGMGPTSLTALASKDVSYIIIKGGGEARNKKRKGDKADSDKPDKVAILRKERETRAITGPFECLQPSTLVADGTCHQIFFSCCEYSAHFRDEHTRRRKGLRCQVCEKPILGAGEEAQAPYPCEVCGAGYETNKELSAHMATEHVKLKPFECSVCGKRFTQQGGVQQHMRMHTGDRPFPCTFCPKAFTQKSGLDQHLRIHTKVKPYRCVICSKTFCQSVHLKQHMRTHTNVSPFQCGICNKRFKQSSHLNYHLKNHSTASMTDEQKLEYKNLLSMMPKDKTNNDNASVNRNEKRKDNVVYVRKRDKRYVCLMRKDNMEYVEVELDGNEVQREEVEEVEDEQEESTYEEETTYEEVPLVDEEVIQEQILAEQSIQEDQVEDGEDTYILSDAGNEVWSVKLVEN